MNQMNQDPGLESPPNNDKISSISVEIIGEILREYPRIQSLDFSYNEL